MPQDKERREDLRAPLPIQVGFNVLGEDDEYVRAGGLVEAPPQVMDTQATLEGNDALERFLLHLDAKLDFIISLLSDRVGRKEYEHRAVVVDISESGLRMAAPIGLSVGDRLEMGLVLPSQPYRTLDILGRVIWKEEAGPEESGPAVGVNFIDVLPKDQDEIVHWVFRKQREEIRKQRDLD